MNKSLKYIFIFLIILFKGNLLICQELELLPEIKYNKFKDDRIFFPNNIVIERNVDLNYFINSIKIQRNGKIEYIDSLELTPYRINLKLYKTNRENTFLLILENEYEFISFYPIYLIEDKRIEKIGELKIGLDCPECDVYNYPLEDIIIKGNQERIEFSFMQDFFIFSEEKTVPVNHREVYYIYKFDKKKLKIKKRKL